MISVRYSIYFVNACVFAVTLFICVAAAAQETQQQPPTAPPPLRVLTSENRTLLAQTKDNKSRVKKTIELGEIHLAKAETHTKAEQYSEALAELGHYWALIEDVLKHIGDLPRDKGKTRDLYKRVELALRAHGIRLTIMRRSTPAEYSFWIKQLEEYARNGRTEALNSFYGHTVIRESKPGPSQNKSDKQSAGGRIPPEEKQP